MAKRFAGVTVLAGLFLLSACLRPAKAVSTPFFSPTGDRTAFTAASMNLMTANFEGAPAADFQAVNPYVEQGVTFTGSAALFLADQNAPDGFFNYGTGDSLLVGDSGIIPPATTQNVGFLTATLPSNITAVGFDYATRSGTPSLFTFTINEATTQTFSFNSSQAPTRAFFGVTSDAPITSLRVALATPTEQFIIDRFSIGQAIAVTAVPEPGTMTLMGLGLAGLIGAGRRKKKAQESASEAV